MAIIPDERLRQVSHLLKNLHTCYCLLIKSFQMLKNAPIGHILQKKEGASKESNGALHPVRNQNQHALGRCHSLKACVLYLR